MEPWGFRASVVNGGHLCHPTERVQVTRFGSRKSWKAVLCCLGGWEDTGYLSFGQTRATTNSLLLSAGRPSSSLFWRVTSSRDKPNKPGKPSVAAVCGPLGQV